MPINVRTNIINYKDPDTNQFVGVDAITDKTTAERVAAIEAAAGEQIGLIEYYNSTITSPTTITRDDGLGLVVGLGTSSANVDALAALTQEVIKESIADLPQEDGTFTLKCIVSSGDHTLYWVKDE